MSILGAFRLLLAILIPLVALAGQRPLDFVDIIEHREPSSPRLSPDGKTVAFLVRQASLLENSSKVELWTVSPGSPPQMLLRESFIGALDWTPDNSALTATLSRPGSVALWRIPLDGGAPRPLFEHPTGVFDYAWSPDGTRILFVTAEPPSAEQKALIDREGIVYDESAHGIRNFTQRTWSRPGAQQLWIWRTGQFRASPLKVDFTPVKGFSRFSWSPAGDKVALEYTARSGSGFGIGEHIGVITCDPSSGEPKDFRPLITTPLTNRGAIWHPDGNAIAFAATGAPGLTYVVTSVPQIIRLGEPKPVIVDAGQKWYFLSTVFFDAPGAHLLIEYENRSRSTLYRVPVHGGQAQPVTQDSAHFSGFHFSRDRKRAACIRQTFVESPEIAILDVDTGRHQVLSKLNPQFESIRLGGAQERHWRNRYGHETNGFLMLPSAFKQGRRVPLLVIQYALSNKFTTQAQWMASYPAQHFAEAGFAVLLLNYPRELGWKPGDFQAAALSQAFNPLASLETAVQSLIDEGIADPGRKGIMGWSFGAWLVEMAITQSNLFQAASAGEGGLNNAGQYWVTGSAAMQRYLDDFFGGPPFGEAYKNYQQLAPALNAHRVKTPLLREYGSDVGVQSLEFYMALRWLGKPVEQVIYPGAPHVLSLPTHRKASMERNLDWFRFWLQDYEDPSPHKRAQFERWRALRTRMR